MPPIVEAEVNQCKVEHWRRITAAAPPTHLQLVHSAFSLLVALFFLVFETPPHAATSPVLSCFFNRLLKSLTGGVPLRGPRTTHRSPSGFQVNSSTISDLSGRFLSLFSPPTATSFYWDVFLQTCSICIFSNSREHRKYGRKFFFNPHGNVNAVPVLKMKLFAQRHSAVCMAHCKACKYTWLGCQFL